jgi:predicted MPP superfamily phosphohydrolase
MPADPRLLVPLPSALLGPPVAILLWRALGPKLRHSRLVRLAFLAFAVGYGLCVWTFLIEPRTLRVHRLQVASAAWSGAPLRIGVVSDTHVGAPHVTPDRVRRTMLRLNRERPDVIVFLGDYAGGHEPAATRAAPDRSAVLSGVAALAAAEAPLGRIAVLGNHDWWYDGPAIEAQLRRAGVKVLENNAVRVQRPGGAFWIAGLADLESRRAEPSPEAALATVPSGEPVILLTHWPDPFPSVPPRVALTLAGHTHCGQVNFPIVGRTVHASEGARRYGCGLYDEGGRKLFVTAGLGVSILPVRFRAPPEIAVITLRTKR